MACYLLIGFELTKKSDIKFSSSFFPRPILIKTDTYGGSEYRTFLLFYQYFYSAPSSFMDVLVEERYGVAGRIPILWGGAELMKKGIFQVNFLVDWHSFLSFEKLDHDIPAAEIETVNYFKRNFPKVFHACSPHTSMRVCEMSCLWLRRFGQICPPTIMISFFLIRNSQKNLGS